MARQREKEHQFQSDTAKIAMPYLLRVVQHPFLLPALSNAIFQKELRFK
ncbi:MAG: hypothetical protein WAM14_18245 [Candidatus Nitrosopolaris sp.]